MSTSTLEAPPERQIEVVMPTGGDRKLVVDMFWAQADPGDDFDIKTADDQCQRAVYSVLDEIERGVVRAAVYENGVTYTSPEVISAIKLAFPLEENQVIHAGPFEWNDKIPVRTGHHDDGRRVVPPAFIRGWCYVSEKAVYMPSYVNLGAYVDDNAMVDTWATVGSCAQVGKGVHLSGNVGLGGVLEPAGATPVIVADGGFVGSRCMVVNGSLVGEGATLAAGSMLNNTTKIIGLDGSYLMPGVIPDWSVCVPHWFIQTQDGELQIDGHGRVHASYAIRVIHQGEPGDKHSDTNINEMLRDHGAALD